MRRLGLLRRLGYLPLPVDTTTVVSTGAVPLTPILLVADWLK
jgi:hypothetical protein